MMDERQIDHVEKTLAKRILSEYQPEGGIRFRGIPIEEFNREELLKIVEITMEQSKSEVEMHKTATDGFIGILDGMRASVDLLREMP